MADTHIQKGKNEASRKESAEHAGKNRDVAVLPSSGNTNQQTGDVDYAANFRERQTHSTAVRQNSCHSNTVKEPIAVESQLLTRNPSPRTSPPAQRTEVGGVGRQAGGGLAACCTQRRTFNTRNPRFTSPLPILLSLDRPPPASLGEEVLFTSPPAQRSEVGGVGRQAGGGPAACCTQRRPNNTRNAPFPGPLPISLSLARPPPASPGEEVLETSPSFAGGGGFNNLPSRGAQRSGRGRPKAGGGLAACCTQRRSNFTLSRDCRGPLPARAREKKSRRYRRSRSHSQGCGSDDLMWRSAKFMNCSQS